MKKTLLPFLGVLIAALVLSGPAAACKPFEIYAMEFHVEKSFSPLFDAGGIRHPGCLLQSKNNILAYAAQEDLCMLKPGEKATVMVDHACCDAGPDDGDLPCLLRTKKSGDADGVHGKGYFITLPGPAESGTAETP